MLIHLVRHGESEANRAHPKKLDVRDPALTPLGLRQARRAAKALKGRGIELLVTSPLLRALQTTQPILKALDCRAEAWPELVEVCFSSQRPYDKNEIHEALPGVDTRFLRAGRDGDWWSRERDRDWKEANERVARAYRRLRRLRLAPEANVAVVLHGGSGSALIDAFLNSPPREGVRYVLKNGGITTLRIKDRSAALCSLNCVQCLPTSSRR